MIIETEILGEVEYLEKDIILFEEGLYGFGGMKEFILLLNPVEELPFHYLQSIEDERLSFVVTSPFIFIKNYEFDLSDTVIEKMRIEAAEDMDIFSIVTIPEKLEETTINLKAPIIVNKSNKKAKQCILNENFVYKQYIFKEVASEGK